MSKLLNNGMFPELSENVLLQLFSKKIISVFDFLRASPTDVMQISGLNYENVYTVRQRIEKLYGGIRMDFSALLADDQIIPTGIKSFDVLTNGGLRPGRMYELCGLPSSGKSQICLTMTALMASQKITVHHIDTKMDICASRIYTILQNRKFSNYESTEIMASIQMTQVRSIDQLMTLLHGFTNSNSSCPQVIIIDSLPELYFKEVDSYATDFHLTKLANTCKFIANQVRAVIICVNMISQWREVDGFASNIYRVPVVTKPSLGKFWKNAIDTRFLVEKIEDEKRKISVWSSTELKVNNSCVVNIDDSGAV